MKTILYKENERGYANHGWLNAHHYFSFAGYYNPAKIQFGALRVLNDDIIQGGTGFGEHPHDNMEIITIPLKGSLKHKDSMSNKWIQLEVGEVQVMSAGTGLIHAEMNGRENEDLSLFQIWIFPDKKNVKPHYDQKMFKVKGRLNKLQKLVTSFNDNDENALKIHQNAVISRIELSENQEYDYEIKDSNKGVFVLLVDGSIQINNELLATRDAIGISEIDKFKIQTRRKSDILFIEVPMVSD